MSGFYVSEVSAQNTLMSGEKKAENTIFDVGGTNGYREWSIDRVLDRKNVSNVSMQVQAKSSFSISEYPDGSVPVTVFSIRFSDAKYRNNSCVSKENNLDKIVKLIIDDNETINPEDPGFTDLTMITEQEQVNKIVEDKFMFSLNFADTKKIANAQTVKYQLCNDTYQLSSSAIKELQYLVAKTEEAANKYNYDLYQKPKSNTIEIPNINIPRFNF